MELVSRLFNGQTSGIPAVTIKSTNKWGFWDAILFFRNQANSKSITIRGPSNVPSTDLDLTLPPIIVNDTLAAIGLAQIFSVVQEFDAGVKLKQQSAPGNPAATVYHFYVNNSGNLVKRNSAGVEINYDVSVAGTPAGSDKQIQYNDGGIIFGAEAGFEYNKTTNELTAPGVTITENLIMSGVISPSQIVSNQNNYNPTNLATSTALRLFTDASRNMTGIVAQPTGTILTIHNIGSFNLVLTDEDTNSTAANRFALSESLTIGPDQSTTIRYDGTSSRWRLTSSIPSSVALLGADQTFTQPQEVNANVENLLELTRPLNTNNTLWGINFWALDSGSALQKYGQLKAKIIDNTAGSEDSILQFTVQTAGADKIISTPSIAADDTLALLGVANVFTDVQTVFKDASALMKLYRDINTAASGIELILNAKSSTSVERTYARFRGEIVTNTNAAEDGKIKLSTMRAGTLTTALELSKDGEIIFGTNQRILMNDTNITAQRNIKHSNTDNIVAGVVLSSGTAVDINTTASETDMLNYSVIANAMGANGSVKFLITGYLLQNQATGTTYTFAIKFGTTTMFADVSPSIAQSATKLPFRIQGEIFNKNATNAQGVSGSIMVNDTTAATTGIGDISDDEILMNANFDSEGADTAKDTTSAQTLQVTVTMSVSNAATHTVIKHKEMILVTSP